MRARCSRAVSTIGLPFVAAIALVGCGEQAAGPAATIHLALPLSGPLAERGRDAERAARMAIDQSGAVEGGRPLKLVVHDTGAGDDNTEAARAAARDTHSVALIGGLTQVGALQARRSIGRGDLLLVTLADANGQGVVLVVPSPSALGDAAVQAAAAAGGDRVEWIADGLPKSVIQGMRNAGRRAGIEVSEAGPGACPKRGVTRVTGIEPPGEETAFVAIHCPDANILVVDTTGGAHQPRAWNGRRLVTPSLAYDDLPPAGRAFYDEFAEKFGRSPDRWAIFAYEATGLVLQAIEDAHDDAGKVTRQAVRDAAFAIENRFGPVGRYDVLPDGQTTLNTIAVRGLPLSDSSGKGTEGTDRVIEAQY